MPDPLISKPDFSQYLPHRFQTLSIRDELERLAWTQNPRTARRLALRLARRLSGDTNRKTDQAGKKIRWAKRSMHWQDRTLLAVGIILLALFFIRTETAAADEPVWGLQLKGSPGEYTQLAIDTAIQVDITGLIARVEVTQHFTNYGTEWAEGIYRFPLPAGAAVDRMHIRIGERVLEGVIQEKATARRVYEKALALGRTASLIEQQRHNQFETRLANIGPGESIEITIGYLQNVSYSELSYHLRIPMTFTPRWNPGQALSTSNLNTSNPNFGALPSLAMPNLPGSRPSEPHLPEPRLAEPVFAPSHSTSDHALRLQANLVSSIEFAVIESLYHDVDIRQVDNGYRIALLDPYAVTDRDFELRWTPALQATPSTSLTTYYDGESVYAQLMLAPPLADSITAQAREVILIIDTSGSMEGPSLEQAKAALLHALKSLGPDDYFNLLQFNSVTEQLFDQSVPTSETSLYVAYNFINGLQANGGTDMEPALKTALAMPEIPQLMRQVVFITDGAVGNDVALLQKVAEELGDSRMFTIAIGHAPNSWFMRKAAEIGRGSYIHIGKLDEVEKQMSALWGRIRVPALTNICVDWGDGAEYYPEIIPDLYAGEPLWLIARLPAEPAIIGLCGDFNGQPWSLDINGWEAAGDPSASDSLAILWARKKIEALEDSLMFGADRELTQLEITALALDYGLLTRHTSLVAVDKTPRRSLSQAIGQTNIPSLLPAGTSSRLAGYPNTALGWVSQLLLSLFVLLLATSLLWLSGSRLPMDKLVRH